MNHQGIEDGDLVEAYVTGRLGEQARAEFEEHFVDCPECLGRVEAAQGLAAGLRGIARETPAASAASAPVRARQRGRARASWMLAAAAMVAVLAWGLDQQRRLSQALTEERAAHAAAEARAQELTQRPVEPREPAALPRPVPPPPGPVPVLTLVVTRGAELPTLQLPHTGGPVVISVERESPPRFSRYRLRLSRDDGTEVLAGVFPPSSRDAVVFAMEAGLLPPGTYAIALEGETANGQRTQRPGHRFRVVR